MTRIVHPLLFTLLLTAGGASAGGGNPLPDLSALAGQEEQKFLPPEQAFELVATVDGTRVVLDWKIHDGYYLYRDKLRITVEGDPATTVALTLPEGEVHEDEFFGKQRVFRGDAEVIATLSGPSRGSLRVQYQGCADAGLCYPPQVSMVALGAAPAAATAASSAMDTAPTPTNAMNEQDRLAEVIRSGSIALLIGTFFALGLALTFTPCVLPMIPILSGIIAGQGTRATPLRSFLLSLTYVLAMAVTYTVAGVLAGLFGQNLQAALQDPWVLGSFSVLFVVLSFSMFGYYELQMPAAVQEKLTALSNKAEGGTFLGVGVMGFLSALIVGPCVTAPLVGALVYIGQSGDPVRGGVALFALSLGMGVPLLLVGSSLGSVLPRAGAWMEKVKQVFGVLLLGTALWFGRTLLPDAVVMALWGLLTLGLGLMLGAFEKAEGLALAKRVLALAFALWGALILVGAATGARDPLAPLERFGAGGGASLSQGLKFQRIKSNAELDAVLAASSGKAVMLDFYADWCISCKEMEKYSFSDARVQAELKDVVLLQADVTANDDADQALMSRFGIFGPPATLFFDGTGQELKVARVVGFMPADRFTAHLQSHLHAR